MSMPSPTTPHGETAGIVKSFVVLRNRLNQLLRTAGGADPSTLGKLAECSRFLGMWERENIDRGHGLRAGDFMSPATVERIRTIITDASDLLVHCEVALGVTSSEARAFDVSMTSNNHRDDCFHTLDRTLRELLQPQPWPFIEVPNATTTRPTPNYPPSSPVTSSSHLAVATPFFDPISSAYTPASQRLQTPPTSYECDEPRVQIKQEQQSDSSPTLFDPFDRVAHLRHDSHLSSHLTSQEAQFENKLPPIAAWHQNAASLAQVPSPSSYGPILPRPASFHKSPSRAPDSSPPARYHSGSIDGNDHQTVLLSHNSLLRPLQPPLNFSNDPMPTLLTSMFTRPQSRARGSSWDR